MKCGACLTEFKALVDPSLENPASSKAAPVPPDPLSPASESESTPSPGKVPPHRSTFRAGKTAAVAGMAAILIAAAGGWAWEVFQRRALETRLNVLEDQAALGLKEIRLLKNDAGRLSEVNESLAQLDEVVAAIITDQKEQTSTVVRADYGLQTAKNVLIRHQHGLGQLHERLTLLEREVADKDRQAKEALALAIQKRKEADDAALPIRQRIRELEEKKEVLFARYRVLSTPRRPRGVVSTKQAAALMRDWQRRAAPLIAQIDEEISIVRQSIEDEEMKLDHLYDFESTGP
ncbi:hypothetical protein [Haloferula sargassicola]